MEFSQEHDKVTAKLLELYKDLFRHNGFGELKMEIKFLKKRGSRAHEAGRRDSGSNKEIF